MPKKATKAETQLRISQIYKMLLSGVGRAEIIQYGSKNWEIGDRQTDDLIARTNKIFEANAEVIRDREFGKSISRLNDLYMRSMQVQDYKTCLSVQKEVIALLGLSAPLKHKVEQELTGKDGAPIAFVKLTDLSDDDIDRILKQAGIGSTGSPP